MAAVGAFIGELPMLGMGCGHLRNRHIYTAQSVVETDLTYLPVTAHSATKEMTMLGRSDRVASSLQCCAGSPHRRPE